MEHGLFRYKSTYAVIIPRVLQYIYFRALFLALLYDSSATHRGNKTQRAERTTHEENELFRLNINGEGRESGLHLKNREHG